MATECMTMLKQSHPIDYNSERDAVVFDVRNLANHLGLVDPNNFDRALTTMVSLAEQLIAIVADRDSSLDRTAFWSVEYFPQVDERLKAQAEARRLKLEQLKAAALHEIERLRARGLDEDVLSEWGDRPPPEFWDERGDVREDDFERRTCPVCRFDGWLEYTTHRGPIEYDWSDDNRAPVMWIDIEHVPREFYCPVCSLRLGDDLLSLVDMGDTRYDTVEPSVDEVQAAEDAAIESYIDQG